MQYIIGVAGLALVFGMAFIVSNDRKKIKYRPILTKCERKAPKFIYGDISSLNNNDSISLFFIVLYF